jgi:hypothetical protein
MAVTQTLRALGHWEVSLRENMPASIWDAIDYFGHVAIHMGRPDPRVSGDSLLRSSRYTGVLRGKSESGLPKQISGLDIAMWLGDPDNKSDIIEDLLEVSGDFETVIEAVMDGFDAVQIGTIFNEAGLFEGSFQFQSRRQAIDYICQTWGGMAWRVNGDATLDAGLETDLFVTDPKVAVIRKPKFLPSLSGSEVDMFLRALNGDLSTQQDVEDLTTRLLLMAQGSNGQFASAAVDAPPGYHPYLDLHGNPIKMTRIAQESETDAGNAEARAQLQLNRFLNTRDALTLSTEFYDISGESRVGDYLWVHDPELKLVDDDNEVIFRGRRLNPMKLQMTETSWPIERGMSVLYRHYNGAWIDLTDFVEWESGETTIVVGGYNRSLTDSGSGAFPITQPDVNSTVPAAPTWIEPFLSGVYQSPGTGETRADVILAWDRPDNTDASVITDGDHYEIRYRQASSPLYPVVWDQIEPPSGLFEVWDQWEATGATWDYPIVYAATDWQIAVAPFDVEAFRLQELAPSMPYEAQIRAVDTGRPPNIGAWSGLVQFQTINDNLPPAPPAPPEVFSNPMAVLMTHNLGRADGGTFNLDRDLHHLELHGGPEPLFTTTEATRIGRVLANYGMMIGEVQVVASFQITSLLPVYFKVVAVDEAGNKSVPSAAVSMTAGLITDQYIANLTAAKITAGTMTASVIVGGRIATMPTSGFPGVELTSQGIEGWNTVGFRSLFWDSTTGRLHVNGNGGIEIKDGNLTVKNAAGVTIVEVGECADGRHGVQVYKDNGTRVARMGEVASGDEGIEVINDLGELVRIDTLAFGTEAATDVSSLIVTGTTYGYSGPGVTVTIGNSKRCIAIVSGTIFGDTGGGGGTGYMGVGYAGPGTTGLATELNSLFFNSQSLFGMGGSKAVLINVDAPGNWTFTAGYKVSAGQTMQFTNRHIVVMPF